MARSDDRGFVLAVVAAAAASLLLFLPVTILGYTAHLLAAALSGEPLSQHNVAETYAFVGIPALISAALLVIPYLMCRAASFRIGHRQSALVIGGLVALWHAAVAIYWAWGSTEGLTHATTGDVLWYPFAFGMAAVIATFLAAGRAAIVPLVLVLVMGLLLSGTVRGRTEVPSGAQRVEVELSSTAVEVNPSTVQAGDVYVVLLTARSSITITEEELVDTDIPTHRDFDLFGCTDAQRAEDRGLQGYCGNVFKVNLSAGTWAVISTDVGGPGQAFGRLEVLP
jgi:hypothetical protein